MFARDEYNTRFNVEMQVARQSLERRARYYHGQMDMEMLLAGTAYDELPNCYVLFICDFDPFMLKKYRYTVKHVFAEDERFTFQDGSHTVFLSTKGENANEVPESLVKFMRFVASGSTADFGDAFVARLQESVKQIKSSREMGERFMLFEEMLRDERAEGKAEGKAEAILELLKLYGEVPEELCARIMAIKDVNALSRLLKCAVSAKSISEFESEVNL